ncbi:hypothetical protein ACQ4PT_031713 [Festuca glaucescens]
MDGGDSGSDFVHLRTEDHDYGLVSEAFAIAHIAALDRDRRHRILFPEASSSACATGSRQKGFRVRHSAMYSDRPRRSRRNRGRQVQQPASSQVQEEDSSKASSSELGPTTSDTSKFETLSLNDSPPALDSSDRAVVHAGDMGTGLPDPTVMVSPAAEEALSGRSEEPSIADLLLNQPTFDSVDDCMDYFCNSERAARAARDKALPFSQQPTLDKFEAERVLVTPNQAQPVPAQEQASAVAAQGRYEGSKGKIAENGNKWMTEELRVALQKYLQKEDALKEFDCEFEELKHQCFHVENYCKIFHHFNFTVKMKKHGSSEWTSTLYFAEVKEIFRRKLYFCCPLKQHENGDCYACKNQRMGVLKHPVIGPFDRGSPDTVFPYTYDNDSSSEDDDGPVYDEAWRRRMRADGVRVG